MPFTKGINKDVEPRLQPDGAYRDARNAVIGTSEGELKRERGPLQVLDLGDVEVRGSITLSSEKVILFLSDTTGSGDDRITVFDPENETSTDQLTDSDISEGSLNFGEYVDSEYRELATGDRIIYWTDDTNPPRFYNLDKDYNNITATDLGLFPSVQTNADFTLEEIGGFGGSLDAGSYNLAFAYVDQDGSTTNYFLFSGDINIPSDGGFGASSDTSTSKAVRFSLSNLDSRYERIQIAAIKETSVEILPQIPFDGSSLVHTFTGNEDGVAGSLEEVLADRAHYTAARTMTQQNGTLYMGNLEQEARKDLQRHVNDIDIEVVPETVPNIQGEDQDMFMTKPENQFDYSTYKRGEVYAFYVTFMLEDGSETDAFHIPGRTAGESIEGALTIQNVPNPSNNAASGTGIISSNSKVPVPGQGEIAEANTITVTGSASGAETIQVKYYDNNDNLVKSPGVSIADGDSAQIIAEKCVSALNNASLFSNIFTASKQENNGSWYVVMTADQVGSDYNNYYCQIENSSNVPHVDGAKTSGGKDDSSNAPPHNITVTWDNGNSSASAAVTTLNGLDTKSQVTDKYKTAINNNGSIPYTASVVDDNKLTLVADQQGRTYNATVDINHNDGTDLYSFNVDEGWDASEDKLSLEVDWGPGLSSFTVDNILPGASKSTVTQAIRDESRNQGFSDISFSSSGKIVYAKDTSEDATDRVGDVPSLLPLVPEPSDWGDWWNPSDWQNRGDTQDIGSNHPLHDYNSEFENNIKVFHAKSESDNPLNMGYWQNFDESYPTTDRWVTEKADGSTGEDLRGQNVRHHRMPEMQDAPYWDEANDEMKVLGLRLKNVHVPSDLEDEITGYKVYYAKKDPQDRLVIDQSTEIHGMEDDPKHWRYSQTFDVIFEDTPIWHSWGWPALTDFVDDGSTFNWTDGSGSVGGGDPNNTYGDTNDKTPGLDTSLLQLHPFEALRKGVSVAGATHVKLVGDLGYMIDDDVELPMSHTRRGYDPFYEIRALKGISYIEQGQRDVQLQSLGFSQDYDNLFGEEKIICELENSLPDSKNYLVDICQLRPNVHVPFSSQELVPTGYVGDVQSPTSDVFFGGDINIEPWWYKTHSLISWYGTDRDKHLALIHPDEAQFKNSVLENVWTELYDDPGSDGADYEEEEGTFRAISELIGDTSNIKTMPNPWGNLWYDLVESRDHPWMRTKGDNKLDSFYPASNDWIGHPVVNELPSKFDQISDLEQKTYARAKWIYKFFQEANQHMEYNDEYSDLGEEDTAFPYQEFDIQPTSFDTRVIRSATVVDGDERSAWREFLEEDAVDLPQHRGEITNLAPSTGGLFIHMKESLFRTRGRKELSANGEDVYVGAGDIFEAPPQEFKDAQSGYAGLDSPQHAEMTPWGYMWVDRQAGKIYGMSGDQGIKELSRKGMRDWFYDHIDKQSDLRIGVDPEEDRVFVDNKTGGWTLSYNPYREMWISRHDLEAQRYFYNRKHAYHSKDGIIYKIGDGSYGDYYGNIQPFELTFAESDAPPESQIVVSAILDCTVLDNNGNEIETDTIDTIRVRNDYQDTGEIILRPKIGPNGERDPRANTRKTDRTWKINSMREDVALPKQSGKRLSGNVHIVDVSFGESTDQRTIHMLDAFLIRRTSKR